jgi:DNA-binding NarL/FixJ family response regulator
MLLPATATNAIRVLLIDDHVVMRAALRILIESQPGLTVVGEASNRADALALAQRERPAIVLLDLDLGGESGVALLPELFEVSSDSRVIVLTGIHNADEYQQAVQLGALGLVLKDEAVDTLVRAIERVHAGEAWLDPRLVARVLSAPVSAPADAQMNKVARLTERERKIIALVCQGLRNRQIGERLYISEATVAHHITSIYSKLGIGNRFELMSFAYRHGLAESR